MDILRGTALGELVRQVEAMPGRTVADKLAAYERELQELCAPGSPHYDDSMGLLGFVAATRRGLPKLERSSLLAPTTEEKVAAIAA